MTTFQDLKTALEQIAAGVDTLEKAIADLKADVGDGHIVTQAELDELGTMAKAVVDDIADTSDQGGTTTPPNPSPLPPVVIIRVDTNFIALVWSAIEGAAHYNVKRGTTAGGETLLDSTTATFFNDSQALAGQVYFYKVSATDANGLEGKDSEEVSVTA